MQYHRLSLLMALVCGTLAMVDADGLPAERAMTLTLTSTAFTPSGALPSRYTCEGPGVSPPLAWQGVPAGAKSLALIEDDPDAPTTTWVHWILYDLPPNSQGLPEGVSQAALPAGTREGSNGWKRAGYGAPCPPTGRHRYFHKLYALDVVLGDLAMPDKHALEAAMHDHVIAQAELVGTYQKRAAK